MADIKVWLQENSITHLAGFLARGRPASPTGSRGHMQVAEMKLPPGVAFTKADAEALSGGIEALNTEAGRWLLPQGYAQYATKFLQEGVESIEDLKMLEFSDLKEIGIPKVVARRKLYKGLEELKKAAERSPQKREEHQGMTFRWAQRAADFGFLPEVAPAVEKAQRGPRPTQEALREMLGAIAEYCGGEVGPAAEVDWSEIQEAGPSFWEDRISAKRIFAERPDLLALRILVKTYNTAPFYSTVRLNHDFTLKEREVCRRRATGPDDLHPRLRAQRQALMEQKQGSRAQSSRSASPPPGGLSRAGGDATLLPPERRRGLDLRLRVGSGGAGSKDYKAVQKTSMSS